MTTSLLVKIVRWVLGEVWEKVNLPAAMLWEAIEDGVFPLLSWWFGVPELIPLFLILHFEPIAYPAIW